MRVITISILAIVTIIVSLIYATFYIKENALVYAYLSDGTTCSDYVEDQHKLTGCVDIRYEGMFEKLNPTNVIKIRTNNK